MKDKFKQIQYTIPSSIEPIKVPYGIDLCIERPNCTTNEVLRLTTQQAKELLRDLNTELEVFILE